MDIFKAFRHNRNSKSFQSKNEALLNCALEQGFSMPAIREGLRVMNRIKLADLTDEIVSIATVSNTIKGRRRNLVVVNKLAKLLGLTYGQLFPGDR